MAEVTGGYHLELGQFEELHELILGLCYAQESPEKFNEFTKVVEAKKPLSRSQFRNFQEQSLTNTESLSSHDRSTETRTQEQMSCLCRTIRKLTGTRKQNLV